MKQINIRLIFGNFKRQDFLVTVFFINKITISEADKNKEV